MRTLQSLTISALVLGLAMGLAEAQVRPVTQDGRALDSNPMVGGGGRNPNPVRPRFNSQLYVTGQVTGLGRFRGGVPYRAENELGITLPSERFSNFLAQSVGAPDVIGGRPYTTSPYYDRQRTIVSRQELDFNKNLRVGVPIENLDATERRDLYLDAAQGYSRLLGAGEEGVALPPATDYQTTIRRPSPAGQEMREGDQARRRMMRAPEPGVFGLDRAEQRYRLARQIAALDETGRSENLQVGRPVEQRQDDRGTGRPAVDPLRQEPGAEDGPGRPLGTDQDVFVDVMRHLQLKRRQEKGQDTGDRTEDLAKGEKVDFGADREVVIESLAGQKRDPLNNFMRSAEAQLRQGRFYDAAALYRRAGRQDPSNPLPQVGTGLALFAAGEPASAAEKIKSALAEFPALMETRVSAGRLLPQRALRKQLAELEDKLEQDAWRDDADMLLLASFLHRATGQTGQARAYARRLSQVSKQDPLLKAYSQYVLTGKRPSGRGGAATPTPTPGE
jgi:tetratricopeptide (TPR) repeat protein